MTRTRLALRLGFIAGLAILLAPAIASAESPESVAALAAQLSNRVDTVWILLCAALVFFMQAGFLCFEVGAVRAKNGGGIAMKNIIDWMMASAGFFVIGFGIMFGVSHFGLIGSGFWLGGGLEFVGQGGWGYTFFLFQLVFAGTALTIVSGAMSERTGFVTYLLASLIMGLVIYPVFGHWVWGTAIHESNTSWLANLGFMDFAGSSVVHLVGASVGLVGITMLGPRIGRYDAEGNLVEFEGSSFPFMALGVFILWTGWIGFNGGSQLAIDDGVPLIIVNTNLAAAFAGLSAFVHAWHAHDRQQLSEKFLGGILGGLVAITACCNVVTPLGAVAVGLIAGVVHNIGFDLIIKRWKLDDPVGAVPVHGICGIFGCLSVALFGQQELLAHPRLTQLGIQIIGCLACIAWTGTTAYVMFALLRRFVGLRVSFEEELTGVTIGHHSAAVETAPATAAPKEALSEDDLKDLL